MGQSVRVEEVGGVDVIRMDRPPVNALDVDGYRELVACMTRVGGSEGRVLAGVPGWFCVGADVGWLERLGTEKDRNAGLREVCGLAQEAVRLLVTGPPTVAVVEGAAAGGGLGLALACDRVCCSEEGLFAGGFRRAGVTPDSGVSFLLPRMVGWGVAKRMLLGGARLSAGAAKEMGMVEEVLEEEDCLERGVGMLKELCGGPPGYVERVRDLVYGRDELLNQLKREEALFAKGSMAEDVEGS